MFCLQTYLLQAAELRHTYAKVKTFIPKHIKVGKNYVVYLSVNKL